MIYFVSELFFIILTTAFLAFLLTRFLFPSEKKTSSESEHKLEDVIDGIHTIEDYISKFSAPVIHNHYKQTAGPELLDQIIERINSAKEEIQQSFQEIPSQIDKIKSEIIQHTDKAYGHLQNSIMEGFENNLEQFKYLLDNYQHKLILDDNLKDSLEVLIEEKMQTVLERINTKPEYDSSHLSHDLQKLSKIMNGFETMIKSIEKSQVKQEQLKVLNDKIEKMLSKKGKSEVKKRAVKKATKKAVKKVAKKKKTNVIKFKKKATKKTTKKATSKKQVDDSLLAAEIRRLVVLALKFPEKFLTAPQKKKTTKKKSSKKKAA